MSSNFQPNIPHNILPSETDVKRDDETQHNFKPNTKKLIISTARIISDKQNDDDNIKLPQKTLENNEDNLTSVDISKDDKVLKAEQNECYVTIDRFMSSKNCIMIYIIIILLTCCGLVNIIIFYLNLYGKQPS